MTTHHKHLRYKQDYYIILIELFITYEPALNNLLRVFYIIKFQTHLYRHILLANRGLKKISMYYDIIIVLDLFKKNNKYQYHCTKALKL